MDWRKTSLVDTMILLGAFSDVPLLHQLSEQQTDGQGIGVRCCSDGHDIDDKDQQG